MKRIKQIVSLLFALILCLTMLPLWTAAEGPTAATEQEGDGKYVDFDDMSFWVNGQQFTLGVNTLQDMIEAGVVFDAEDLEDAENNLRKNLRSETFKFSISAHGYATVRVINATDKGKRLADCVLCRIYVSFYDHPEEIGDSILSFAFPMSMTKDKLLENAGEPDDKSHYDGSRYTSDTFEYRKSGRKYFGYNKYIFDFYNDVLTYVTIEYLP